MSNYEIKHSTELMKNYLQATIMAPEKDFRALQKNDGGALLFSIGSDASFNLTAESIGKSHGFQPTISLSKDYAGSPCQHFAVAQRADKSIYMAMVLRETKDTISNDLLYLASLDLSKSGDINPPKWDAFPYDDPKTSRPKIEIAGIMISEATDGEHIVADVVRDPSSPTKEIVRYYIDPAKYEGHAWHLHDLPVDIESGKYSSVLGRRAGDGVDGIYTSGQIDGSPQIIYTPLYNEVRRDHHPLSANLKLSGGGNLIADAIAACPNPDNSTDLYATANGVLYRFDSALQENDDNSDVIATIATSNPLFQGVKDLFAFAYADSVMVWGRNADYAIFYTTCLRSQVDTPTAWSVPLPIMSGVQQVAPFVNRANSANTFFAHTEGNQLKIAVKSPQKNGRWNVRDIHLPPLSPKVKAQQFNSYTTHIKVSGTNKQPVSGRKVGISAKDVTSVYINHLYYVVGPKQIFVDPDPTGSVTLVEAVSRLDATQFSVSVVGDDGKPACLNPMQDASTVAKKLQTLKTPDGLVAASIHYQNEKIKPSKKLVLDAKRNVKDPDVKAAAANIDNLWKAHDRLANESNNLAVSALPPDRSTGSSAFVGTMNPVLVDAGDLLHMLESRTAPAVFAGHRAVASTSGETWWEAFVEWIKGAWHFIVQIGEMFFAFVFEVIEDVFAAFKYVFNKIVELIEDVIEFVKFLFDVEDMQRTKDVFLHVTTLFLQAQVDHISTVRRDFDHWIDPIIGNINAWLGMKDDELHLPNPLTEPINQIPTSSPGAGASDSFLAYHFMNGMQDASLEGDYAPPPESSPLLAKLEGLLKEEAQTLLDAFSRLQLLVTDIGGKEPVDVVKELVSVLAKVVLKSFKTVVDVLLALLESVAQAAVQLLTDNLYIPVVSEILSEFGIPEFSPLDVITWLAAIPTTIGYKIVTGDVPFADNELTRFLSRDATDFKSIVDKFAPAPRPESEAVGDGAASTSFAGANQPDGTDRKAFSAAFHFGSAALALCTAGFGLAEIYLKDDAGVVPVPVRALIGGVGLADAGVRLAVNSIVPHVPLKDPTTAGVSNTINWLTFLQKTIFAAGPTLVHGEDSRMKVFVKFGAVTDICCLIAQAVMTGFHIHEIRQAASYGHNEKQAILDEVSRICVYAARVCRNVLALDDSKASAEYLIPGFIAARGFQALFQLTEGIVELSDPHPTQ